MTNFSSCPFENGLESSNEDGTQGKNFGDAHLEAFSVLLLKITL